MQGRTLPVLLLVGLLTAGAAAADDLDPTKEVAAEEEVKCLEGTWEVVYCEEDGTADPKRIGTRIVFDKGRVRLDDKFEREYRVDPRNQPAWLDVECARLPRALKGNQRANMPVVVLIGFQGIYRREGDRMGLCYSCDFRGTPRPTDFSTGEDHPGTLLSLRRVQPEAK